MRVPIIYKKLTFRVGFRADVIVNDLVVCELKAFADDNKVFAAQLLTYLKLTRKRLGLVINFNVPLIRKGIQRVVHS